VQTTDGGGLKMTAKQMQKVVNGQAGVTVNIASFEANMFA